MVEGGCLCGAVRYASDAEPRDETLCHCRSCRRAAGAHVVGWFSAPAASVRFAGAEPVRFRSSPGVERGFCGVCGTTLTYRSDAFPDEIDLTLASLDRPERWPPRDHTQVADRLPWDVVCDGLPAFATTRQEAGAEEPAR